MLLRSDPDIKRAAEVALGFPIERLTRAGSGANSHVFRAEARARRYAVKIYPIRPGDLRPRVATEWRALMFLRENGVAAAPQPVARDIDQSVLVMEWVEGASIDVAQNTDIMECLAFLGRIFLLSTAKFADQFDLASEACLSGREICRQIARRRAEFITHPGLQKFLEDVFDPALERARAAAQHDSFDHLLPQPLRRLIPADFGFHNAIRESSGQLRFIDFDYFGWDDPVKLAADFILHPAMNLAPAQREQFVTGVSRLLPDDREFIDRLRRYKPLYALRWTLILLNPFRSDRRGEQETADILDQQLLKASAMCASAQTDLVG